MRATTTRYPGGRVEVEIELTNTSDRAVASGVTSVTCGENAWKIELPAIEPGKTVRANRRLPPHRRCQRYEVSLSDARW